jgi:glycosyltransferase involved in cell wall biosynthesis
MNITFLLPMGEFYSPVSGGAIATIAMQFTRHLAARGHNVSILTQINGDPTYEHGTIRRIESRERHELTFAQRAVSKVQTRLAKWDRAYYKWYRDSFSSVLATLTPAPDAIIVFNDFNSPVYLKKQFPKAKIIVDLQNEQATQVNRDSLKAAVFRFVTCSKHIRQWTTSAHHLPNEQFKVIQNGVDPEAFFPRPNFAAPRGSNEKVRVLFIGRIDPNKGPDIAADAVAALQKENLPVEMSVAGGLWFYGHGKEMSDPFFRSLKEKLDVIGANYLGHVTRPNVPAVIREHDIVCVLSRSNEPFGLVVLEAMASGCAVIASNRGGLPDACGAAGIQVNPDDMPAVVNAMRLLVADGNALVEEKQRSVARAQSGTWAQRTMELESLLHQ